MSTLPYRGTSQAGVRRTARSASPLYNPYSHPRMSTRLPGFRDVERATRSAQDDDLSDVGSLVLPPISWVQESQIDRQHSAPDQCSVSAGVSWAHAPPLEHLELSPAQYQTALAAPRTPIEPAEQSISTPPMPYGGLPIFGRRDSYPTPQAAGLMRTATSPTSPSILQTTDQLSQIGSETSAATKHADQQKKKRNGAKALAGFTEEQAVDKVGFGSSFTQSGGDSDSTKSNKNKSGLRYQKPAINKFLSELPATLYNYFNLFGLSDKQTRQYHPELLEFKRSLCCEARCTHGEDVSCSLSNKDIEEFPKHDPYDDSELTKFDLKLPAFQARFLLTACEDNEDKAACEFIRTRIEINAHPPLRLRPKL